MKIYFAFILLLSMSNCCMQHKKNQLEEMKMNGITIQKFIPGEQGQQEYFEIQFPCETAENYFIAYYKTYSGIINSSLKSKQNFCSGTLKKNTDAVPEILQSTLQNTESIVLGIKKDKEIKYIFVKEFKVLESMNLP
jgi:hypothetical protein